MRTLSRSASRPHIPLRACCRSQLRLYASRSASEKLFSDAQAEEGHTQAESSSAQRAKLSAQQQHENWTGEESIQDAVLRMLVDKYKPLRTGTIISADEKLKQPSYAPRVSSKPIDLPPPQVPSRESGLPNPIGADGVHRPWLVTFKTPSHATIVPAIKHGRVPSSPSLAPGTSGVLSEDPRVRAAARKAKKTQASAGRLTKAKESMLDYKLSGSLDAVESAKTTRTPPEHDEETSTTRRFAANPVSLRAWNSLIEDKIERARAKGAFDNLKGTGKPLVRDIGSDHNPYLSREDFLINRIVQRQGAAPPWVEVQGEMTRGLSTFRQSLQDAWVRRVVRTLTTDRPASSFNLSSSPFSVEALGKIRDGEWEKREERYHTHSITEINSLIDKYNTLAPYAVRKPYIVLRAELDACFETAAVHILEELKKRAKGDVGGTLKYVPGESKRGSGSNGGQGLKSDTFGIGKLVRRWLGIA